MFISPGTGSGGAVLTEEEAKAEMLEFINNNLLQPGSAAEITSIEEEAGLYKMNVSLQGQDLISYVTKDGKTFFPQAMVVDDIIAASTAQTDAAQQQAAGVTKSDKPTADLYIFSYCPAGSSTLYAPICWVIPPNSPATTSVERIASSNLVFP